MLVAAGWSCILVKWTTFLRQGAPVILCKLSQPRCLFLERSTQCNRTNPYKSESSKDSVFFAVRVCIERGGINRSEHSLVNCNDFCFVFVYAVHNVLLWLSNFTFWDFYFHSDSAPFLLSFLKVHHLFEINLKTDILFVFRTKLVELEFSSARFFFRGEAAPTVTVPLRLLAWARSGDKGMLVWNWLSFW